MKIEIVFRLAITGILIFPLGCQSDDNPWQVEKYRSPGEFTPTPQSTYAPVPRILPSIKGGGFDPTVQNDDSGDELERILEELQVR